MMHALKIALEILGGCTVLWFIVAGTAIMLGVVDEEEKEREFALRMERHAREFEASE